MEKIIPILFSILFSINISYAKDIAGKWTTTIRHDESAISEVKVHIEYFKLGNWESINKGTLESDWGKATYEIYEKGEWYIQDGYLCSKLNVSLLKKLSGSSKLIEIIKQHYYNNIRSVIENQTKVEIIEIADTQFVLLNKYTDGSTEQRVYTKVE